MGEDSWSWDRSRIERELATMEKELRLLKTKLDNSIIDIRAVNYWGWTTAEKQIWDVVRHEIQYKRQGSPEWIPLPIVHRDLDELNVTQIPLPTGELEE
jgi:hypothetical protein